MDSLIIKEFISIYQYAIFNQVRLAYNALTPDDDFGETVIRFNENLIKSPKNNSIIFFMLNCTNLGGVVQVLGNFKFLNPTIEEGKFLFFGRDNSYNFDIGLDYSSGKVILFDNEQYSYTYIAKNELHFLNFLKTYLEYTIFRSRIGDLKQLANWVREKSIIDAGGEEYKEYYTFLFPNENEQKQDRILSLPYKL